jgi:hypothetical protein
MPVDAPGSQSVHVDALLTQISIGIRNVNFIARSVAPYLTVTKQSDIVPQYTKSHWFRSDVKVVSEREAPPVSGYEVDNSETYHCKEYSHGHFIGDARRANTDSPYNADRDGVEWVTYQLELDHEILFVSNFWKTGVWGSDLVGATDFTKFSDYANSNPIPVFRQAKRTIRRGLGGRNPNTMVLGDLTFDALADHPTILDRIKYTGSEASPATVSTRALAAILELERVLVGTAMYTTDPRGTAEASVTYTSLWDDDALLLYVAPRVSLFSPTALLTFVWQTAFGGPRYVKRRRDPQSDKGDLIEAFQHMDMKALSADAGVFLSDATDAPAIT